MLRLAFCAALIAATPAAAQMQNNTPAAGEGITGWAMPVPGGDYAFGTLAYNHALPARPDQVRVGSLVRSTNGRPIGRIAYVDSNVAVVKSDHWALRLPLKAFGAGHESLLLELSPSSFNKLAETHGARVG